jgi:hypothetical protein
MNILAKAGKALVAVLAQVIAGEKTKAAEALAAAEKTLLEAAALHFRFACDSNYQKLKEVEEKAKEK